MKKLWPTMPGTQQLGASILLALSLFACSKSEVSPVPTSVAGEQSARLVSPAAPNGPGGGFPNPLGARSSPANSSYQPAAAIKTLLTGGSAKTWKLDNTADAPITVGTEANPTVYFTGVRAGELPPCQADDEYTFSTKNVFGYDAKAETFSAAAGYTCKAPETNTSPFRFDFAAGAGLAQFTLTRPGAFIGTTDAAPAEQVYRILSIDGQHLLLRAGSGRSGGVVFTFKMVAK